MKRDTLRRCAGTVLLATLGTDWEPSAIAGPAEDDAAQLARLGSIRAELREIQQERGRWCLGVATAGSAVRCDELESRWLELERSALPAEILAVLAKELPATIEEVATIAYLLRQEEAVPALRRAMKDLEGQSRELVLRVLCGLGDLETLEAVHGEEWKVLLSRAMASVSTRHELIPRLVATCGDVVLADRVERRARVLVEVTVVPLPRAFHADDVELRSGETVTVFLDGRKGWGREGQHLIIAHGETAWIDGRLLHEGEAPDVAVLLSRIAEALSTASHLELLEPIQMLAALHGIDVESAVQPLGLPAGVAGVLSRLARVVRRGAGETYERREVVELEVLPILSDHAAEIRIGFENGYWEGRGETTEILYGIDGSGAAPRRLAVRTLEDDLFFSVFRRFPHLVDLDDDADLEIVILEGTLDYEPTARSRSWKVHLLDFDGDRFVHVPWTPRMREFLGRRWTQATDPLERTILLSHFGPDGPGR